MNKLSLVLVTGFSALALGKGVSPTLVKTVQGGGPLPPGVAPKSESCHIFNDHVAYKESDGAAKVELPVVPTEKLKTTQAAVSLLKHIKNKGTYTETEGPTDVPTVTYKGYILNGPGKPTEVLVTSTGSVIKTTTEVKEGKLLTEFLDKNCNPQPEVLALLESEGYATVLDAVKHVQPIGFTAAAAGYDVTKIGESTFVYVQINQINLTTMKQSKSLGQIVAGVKYKDGAVELDGVYFKSMAEPARP